MSFEMTWLGHGSWSLNIGESRVLIDPFITENPAARCKAEGLAADYILVSHGHFDHVADVAPIANRTGATVVASYEIAQWFQTKHQVENTLGMNLGGGVSLPFGRVTMTNAVHSSQLPDGSYGGNPAGFVIEAEQRRVYFACDTALFGDMTIIGAAGLDVAVLPIGDLFTMGPAESVSAAKLLGAKKVVPAHYNTWPPIEQNAADWAELIRGGSDAEPVVLDVMETLLV